MANVIGTARAIQKIRRVRAATLAVVSDTAIQKLLLSRALARFDAGVDPNNRPWPGLSEETVRTKRAKGYDKPNQPLYATGRLRKSIGIIRGRNTGLLAGATGAGFRIGVTDREVSEYARLHNFGIGQERRQFIAVGSLDSRAVQNLINTRLRLVSNV